MESYIKIITDLYLWRFPVSARFLFFFTLLYSYQVCADTNVSILLSSDKALYQQVAKAASSQFGSQIDINQLTVKDATSNHDQFKKISNSDYVIAVGTAAARFLAERQLNNNVLSIFITGRSFESIIRQYPSAAINFSAIYLDQPYFRIINLAVAVKPDLGRIGLVLPTGSTSVIEEISATGRKHNLSLESRILKESDNPISIIEDVFERSDMLLVLADNPEFLRRTAKWILYLSAYNQKPVIGFSEKYVAAGALAAVYSSPYDVGQEAGELVSFWQKNSRPESPRRTYGRNFRIAVNNKVVETMGLSPLDPEKLRQQLTIAEQQKQIPCAEYNCPGNEYKEEFNNDK